MSTWVFLTVNRRYAKRDAKEIVSAEIETIIGDDLIDYEIPNLTEFEEGEGYLFLKCGDYYLHKDKIIKSRIFSGVIPSYDNPSFQKDEDIAIYRESVEKHERPITLLPGCCVEVKKGDYKCLFGLVCDVLPDYMYNVQFKLYTTKKYEIFHVSDLLFVKNIYTTVKNPVVGGDRVKELKNLPIPRSITDYMENLKKIVDFN